MCRRTELVAVFFEHSCVKAQNFLAGRVMIGFSRSPVRHRCVSRATNALIVSGLWVRPVGMRGVCVCVCAA